MEMTTAAQQLGSSQASPDSTSPVVGTGNTTRNDAWPPLEVTDYSLEEWPNSNKKTPYEISAAEETAPQNSNHSTPVAAPRTPSVNKNPLGSHALGIDANRNDQNPFLSGYAQKAGPSAAPTERNDNQPMQVEDNPLRYVFRTPPSRSLDLAPRRMETPNFTPNSKASADTAPDSTVTKITKESQAMREDFRNSLTQLSQVHSRLSRENAEHVMRADVIMRDMDDMRKGLLEIQAEGRRSQGRLEASMASLNDLIKQRENMADTRMAEMSAVMKERDRQADERMKMMSDLMQRKETDANTRMIDLMTTMKDLTLGVRAMAAQTAATQTKTTPAAPMTSRSDDQPSTSAAPNPTQATYRKIAQSNPEQTKHVKLIPPATYKRDQPRTNKMARIIRTESCDVGTNPLTSVSFDPYARGASTTGDYYSPASGMTTRESNYYTARTNISDNSPKQAYLDLISRPVASSTQRKSTTKRDLEQDNEEMEQLPETPSAIPDTPRTSQRQALVEAISTAMSKGLEPLLAAKESKNKPTKYRGTKDGNADGWMMLMKRHLEKAHARATPLDKAWTIIEYLEHEARDYITNKSEAERDTDEKVFALLARRFGTGSSKIHIQQQFRTRNQNNEEDYMQYLNALEGLRSQGYPNEEVTVRRYEIMQKFIEGVRNFELKRNLALMYAQEQYVEAPPTVEALRFTVQQYLRIRGSNRSENYQMAQPQQPQPPQPNLQPKLPQANPPPIQQPQIQQPQQVLPPPQQAPYRQQPQRACFNCGDTSHVVIDCPLKDRARKPVQQQVNSCHTNPSGGWTCPSQPHGINNEIYPASLPIQGTVAFCVNCGCTEHSASECMAPEYPRQEDQIRAAWYAPHTNQFDGAPQDDQVRVISVAEAGGPSRPVVITCGEKQVLTTLEAPAPDCTETLISIHLLLSVEQKSRPELTLTQLKEELCRNTKYTVAARP